MRAQEQEFADQVSEEALARFGGEVTPFVRPAVREFRRAGRMSVSDVFPCVMRVGELRDAVQDGTVELVQRDVGLDPTESAHAIAGRQLREIEDRVRDLRRRLFGREEPRFRTWPRAVAWIQHEHRQGRRRRVPRGAGARAFALARQLERITGDPWSPRRVVLTYAPARRRAGRGKRRSTPLLALPVDRSSLLGALAEDVGRFARATGFDEAALVRLVLVGTRPTLARVTVRLETPPHRVVVVFQAPASAAELRHVYRKHVLPAWSAAPGDDPRASRLGRVRDLAPQDGRLLDLLQRSGTWPASLTEWERIARRFPQESRPSAVALRSRARRLRQKVGRLGWPIPAGLAGPSRMRTGAEVESVG